MKKTKEEVMRETEHILADDAAIIRVYEKVLSGELKRFPKYTWELPNSLYYAQTITRYLFEKKLNWSIDDIKNQFETNVIIHYKIKGMLAALFTHIFELVDNAYPNKIHPWELTNPPSGFWKSDANKKKALRWLFEEKLGGDLETIKKNLSTHTFAQYGLAGLLKNFQGSPYKTLECIYPGKVKQWELGTVPTRFWSCDTNKRKALKWLFEDVFEGDLTKITQNLSVNTFKQYKLAGLLNCFNGSPYQALDFYYPNKLKPWELANPPMSFWISEQNRKTALLWLFEEKMEGNLTNISHKAFQQYHLSSLLSKHFNNNMQKAIEFAYNDTVKTQPFKMSS